jgi:hypothetical protein
MCLTGAPALFKPRRVPPPPPPAALFPAASALLLTQAVAWSSFRPCCSS